MDKMKLLYFVSEDWYFCSHRLAHARAAIAAGHDVGVVTRVRNHGQQIREAGVRLIPFEMSRSGMNPLADLGVLARLIGIYRREQPDIVHHVAIKPVLYGSMAAAVVRVPGVLNALGGLGWLQTSGRGLVRILKPLVWRVLGRQLRRGVTLVQNPDDARVLTRLGVAPERIRRIPGAGVDLKRFALRPEPEGVPVVVFPARLLREKGVGEFVDAARILRRTGVEARFVLVGAPDALNPGAISQDQVDRWVAEGTVEATGWVEDVASALAASHVVCLPSYREGMPKSLIEAAAAGRPIVTTDVPGCREVVTDGVNGLLVAPRDARSLAAALDRLIRDAPLRQRFGLAGRAKAEREYAVERISAEILRLYREIAA